MDRVDRQILDAEINSREKTIAEQAEQIAELQDEIAWLKKTPSGQDQIIIKQAERIELLEKSLKFQIDLGDKFQAENARLDNENELLKEFAHSVIKQECWGYDMDGFEIQELAEKLGLIKEHIATKDDVDEFTDFEVGDKIYKFTDILKGQDNENT